MTFDQFASQAFVFLDRLFDDMSKSGFSIEKHWNLDHLCYRVESLESYQTFKSEFSAYATLLVESPVKGRPIATFKLHQALQYRDWVIDVVELPAPKQGKIVREGFEHIEVVIDIPFAKVEELNPQLNFDRSGLQKDFNQELEINFENGAIKLHHLSLESVVNFEKSRAFDVLERSDVLKRLKIYSPLVAGTFPLNIATSKSDLDILISYPDLDVLEADLRGQLSSYANFALEREEVKGRTSLVASFNFEGMEFEVFAQALLAIEQDGYRHLLIEERLLKLGGPDFLHAVRGHRSSGVKTEPAFENALNYVGDAYAELLRMQRFDEARLKEILRVNQYKLPEFIEHRRSF